MTARCMWCLTFAADVDDDEAWARHLRAIHGVLDPQPPWPARWAIAARQRPSGDDR